MSIAHHIREIGRGKDGARSLGEAQAHDLMSRVLDRSVTDLEIGAFAIAMRIKGESVAELAGVLAAAHERCIRVPTRRQTVVLPSCKARSMPWPTNRTKKPAPKRPKTIEGTPARLFTAPRMMRVNGELMRASSVR